MKKIIFLLTVFFCVNSLFAQEKRKGQCTTERTVNVVHYYRTVISGKNNKPNILEFYLEKNGNFPVETEPTKGYGKNGNVSKIEVFDTYGNLVFSRANFISNSMENKVYNPYSNTGINEAEEICMVQKQIMDEVANFLVQNSWTTKELRTVVVPCQQYSGGIISGSSSKKEDCHCDNKTISRGETVDGNVTGYPKSNKIDFGKQEYVFRNIPVIPKPTPETQQSIMYVDDGVAATIPRINLVDTKKKEKTWFGRNWGYIALGVGIIGGDLVEGNGLDFYGVFNKNQKPETTNPVYNPGTAGKASFTFGKTNIPGAGGLIPTAGISFGF